MRPSRRQIALGGGAAVALAAAASLVAISRPEPIDSSGDVDRFLRLSSILTLRADLDVDAGARLHHAHTALDPDFPRQVGFLLERISAMKLLQPTGLAAALDAEEPLLASTLHRIVSGWYLGFVGTGPTARPVAGERALMYDVVRDVLGPPAMCGRAPDDWAAPPPPA